MNQILVVDDDPVVSALVSALLSRAGWRTTLLSNAQSALEHLERETCDVVITDVNMPGMTGVQLLDRIRSTARLANLPVVLLTATRADTAIVPFDDKATLVLHKPVRPAAFAQEIRDWLQSLE